MGQQTLPRHGGPSEQTTAAGPSAPSQQKTHRPPTRYAPQQGLAFVNPEFLGDTSEPESDHEDAENVKTATRYTGRSDQIAEDPECSDPEAIKGMQFSDRAMWLGKWFAHHYAAWVSEFDMKELETYERNEQTIRDAGVSPVAMLWWTFRRFRIPEVEWRNPVFCSPVRGYPAFHQDFSHHSSVPGWPQAFSL